MGSSEKFPYTNFHDLNLDWILNELKTLDKTISDFVAINALKYADPIQWNITTQYEKNTIVIDPLTGTAYISVQPVPSGVALTNTDYWTVVFDLGSFVVRAAKNFTDKWEEETTLTATFSSNVNDWLIWGDTLYRVATPIVAGDQYVVGSNIIHFNMEETIGHLQDLTTSDVSNLVAAINELVSRINAGYEVISPRYVPGASTVSTLVADVNPPEWIIWGDALYETIATVHEGDTLVVNGNIKRIFVEGVFNKVEGEIGVLSSLNTTNKSSAVAAINEVLAAVNAVVTSIGDLDNLNTIDKSSIVAAICENRDLIDVLNSTVGALWRTSPFQQYSDYLTVGPHSGQYTTITAAYNQAKTYASASNKVAIIILPGTYREQITDLDAEGIDIYGIGSVTWIYSADYPNSPLYLNGPMEVHNINFVQDKAGSAAYSVHVEGGKAGDIVFDSCTFTSISCQAVGVGFTGNRKVTFKNCQFTSWVQECLYFHNRADANAQNQDLEIFTCGFTTLNSSSPVVIGEDARYRAGTTGTVTDSIVYVKADNCFSDVNKVRYQEVTGGVISYSIPFIPVDGAPYYKFIALRPSSKNQLIGLSADDYLFKIGSSGMFDPSCNFVIPFKNAEKYNVTAFVQLGGIGGSNITSYIEVTVTEGQIKLHSTNSSHAASQMYAQLTFTLA